MKKIGVLLLVVALFGAVAFLWDKYFAVEDHSQSVGVSMISEMSFQPRQRFPQKDRSWAAKLTRLEKNLVPSSGNATTVQGELVRCIGNLTDEAWRNGNMNWGKRYVKMAEFIERKLDDTDVFGAEELATIRRAVAEVKSGSNSPDTSDLGSCYSFLGEKIVLWCEAKRQLIPLTSAGND